MIKKIVYKCEFCHTEYLDKSECERCESHHKPIQVAEARYVPYKNSHSGFPVQIKLVSDNGNYRWYSRIC